MIDPVATTHMGLPPVGGVDPLLFTHLGYLVLLGTPGQTIEDTVTVVLEVRDSVTAVLSVSADVTAVTASSAPVCAVTQVRDTVTIEEG